MIMAKHCEARQRKGTLNKPPAVLLHALSHLKAQHEMDGSDIPRLLDEFWKSKPRMKNGAPGKPGYVHQGFENDRLFQSTCNHVSGSTCKDCDQSQEIKRVEREDADPRIHYGLIASGNTVVKDAVFRDEISEVIGQGCMCFEMEAAGLMDSFPCLVIRGICDYADSHKNDRWQRYAAATAAAFAKELLGYVPTAQLNATQRAIELLSSSWSILKIENTRC